MKPIHLCCITVLSVFLLQQSYSQGESAVPFLLIHPSPEANGRGNTAVAFLSDNPIATLANPAQLGIFGLTNFFAASSYAPKTEWLPSFGVSELTYKVWAIQGGYDLSQELSLPFPISVGAGYSRIDLNLGTFIRTDASGREIGRFSAFENSENISIAVGADYFVKVGLGWNFKNIRSVLSPSGNANIPAEANLSATDFGIILQAPIFDILTRAGSDEVSIFPSTHPLLNFTLGYAKSNIGGNVNYPLGGPADPLPRNASIGLSAEIGITTKAESEQWKIFSFTLAREAADVLIARKSDGTFDYQSGLGDISFFDNVILGKVRSQENVMKGWQLNFGEVVYVRGGSFAESENFGNRNYSTSGFGIRIGGLFKTMQVVSPESMENATVAFLAKHFDLGYDHAKYEAESGHPLDGTTFNALTLVFK